MATSIKRSKGSQSSLQIGTFSYWIKIATPNSVSGGFQVYSNTVENDNNRGYWQYTSAGKWRMVDNDASGTHIQLRTNRLFRDSNAWTHIVIRIDTTQSTNSDRVRLYVNGVQETSFDQTDYPAQNENLKIFEGGQTNREYMNRIYGGSPQSANWYVSHFHYCDGQSYGPDSFGSTDATTGEWSIKTSPSVTYGNQGWFMFKDDASLNDDSGNSNNWSSDSGTIQKSEDNPSNIFATLNPLFYSADVTISDGNTTAVESSNNWRSAYSTLGVSTGKWYWEAQISYQSGNEGYFGLAHEDHMNGYDVTYGGSSQTAAPNRGGYDYLGYSTKSFGIYSNGNQDYPSTTTYTGAYNASTYVMSFALDLPNRKLYVARNGVWTNASNNDWGSSTFNASTGDIDISGKIPASGFVFPGFSPNESTWKVNFGNGYFGTTAISSPQQDDAGLGNFQYNPPTGYYSICTKNINTYG